MNEASLSTFDEACMTFGRSILFAFVFFVLWFGSLWIWEKARNWWRAREARKNRPLSAGERREKWAANLKAAFEKPPAGVWCEGNDEVLRVYYADSQAEGPVEVLTVIDVP